MAKEQKKENAQEALAQFKAELKSGQLHTFYLFCGEEAYLRTYYLEQLSKKLTGGVADTFNVHRFDTQTLSPEALAEAVEAMPMMAERSFVRIDDVDFTLMLEEEREKYAQIFDDIPEYCCVVLAYSAIEYKSNIHTKKLNDVIKKRARFLSFEKQSERELISWICRHFRAHEKQISDELCRHLIFLTDSSMQTLVTEIDKIASYARAVNICREDIDAVVIPTPNAGAFDISNAIAEGNYEKALQKLQVRLAMQEDPIAILASISAQLRRLHYARLVMAAGKGQDVLMEVTGQKSSYAAGLTMNAARRVSDEFCRRAMELCFETDMQMKKSFGKSEHLLMLLLATLSQEVRRA